MGNLQQKPLNKIQQKFRHRNPEYNKFVRYFSPSFGIQHVQLKKLGSGKEKGIWNS